MMLDTSSLCARVQHITRIEVVDGQVKTGEILSSEIVGFSCAEHPEHLWRGWQWEDVLAHLVKDHSGATEENGSTPYLETTQASEHVSVGLEPPSDEPSADDEEQRPELSA